MNNTKDHQKLVDDILFAVGSQPWARVWPAVNGTFRAFDDEDRIVSVGLPGAADISGILDDGRRLEIEVKTGTGKLTKKQKAFKAMIQKFQGVYIEARSVEDVIRALRPEVGSI